MTFIVDASLAAKWLTLESDSDSARGFLALHAGQLHAPDLLLVEVGQMLVRQANERKQSREDAERGLAELHRIVTTMVSLHRILPDITLIAAGMALSLSHPIKDCIYLALADALGVPLITCDAKFHDRVGDPSRVRLLAATA